MVSPITGSVTSGMGSNVRTGFRLDDGDEVTEGHIGVIKVETPSGTRGGGESRGVMERRNHQHTGPMALGTTS